MTADVAGGLLTGTAGDDVLTGGAGADTFVLDFDGERDHVTDFDPAVDQLDLSSWPNLYDPNLVNVGTTPWGANVSFQGELLVVISTDRTPLTREDIVGSIVQDAPTRPPIILIDNTLPEPDQVLTGTPDIDVLEGGLAMTGFGG